MSEFNFRKATRRDDATIVEIDRETFPGSDDALQSGIFPLFRAIVSEAPDGRLAGFVAYRIDLPARVFEIWSIVVLPEFRRQGIGRGLLCELVDQLASWNRRHLPRDRMKAAQATVIEWNLDAMEFFATLGWTSRLARGAFDDGDTDGVVFEWEALP